MKMFSLLAGLICATASLAWAGSPVNFAEPPTAVRDGGRVTIRFAASAPTDVAVWIETADGKPVRHLAAGVLGANAPAPLKADSLSQQLVWDGKDDLGGDRLADGGPFTVRVALGLSPRLDQVHGNNPADLGGVRAMAVGPDGLVYMIHCYGSQHSNDNSAACVVFDRQGRYQRTILPWSADLPAERLAGIRQITRSDGQRAPFVYQPETRSYLPGLGDLPNQRMVVHDGKLAFVGIQEGPRPFAQPGQARLTVLATDGGATPGGLLRTLISPLTDTGASLAVSPDGKALYATGVRMGTHANDAGPLFVCDVCDHGGATWDHTIATPYVYTFGWDDAQAQLFVGGQTGEAGRQNKLVEPVSVATDGQGNVYVADIAASELVVFSRNSRDTGALIKRIALDLPPIRVEVHRTSGAIYVLAGKKEIYLIKLDGLENAREVTRMLVARYERGYSPTRRPIMALDDQGDKPIIWLGHPLSRIEDQGKQFAQPLDLREAGLLGSPAMAAVMEMSVDRQHGRLFVNNNRYLDLASRTWTKIEVVGGRMWPTAYPGSATGNAGRDGNYYVDIGSRGAYITRYGGDLKPLPFANGDDPDGQGRIRGFARNRGVGLTADVHGNVYALWKKYGDKLTDGDAHKSAALCSYNPDGSMKKSLLVDSSVPGIYCPRVDAAGNIYLVLALRPGDAWVPPGLENQIPRSPQDPDAVNRLNAYPLIYGSVVKFGPEGGVVRQGAGGVDCNYAHGTPIQVKGAQWIAPGVSLAGSLATPKRHPGTVISCVCEYPNIDVDAFGRTFFPDAAQCRVGMLDTAGNVIGYFGQYGNGDAAGPGSRSPSVAIPMWWPQAVAASDSAVFVGDRLNRRILEVKLDYHAQAACPVPAK